MERQVKCKNRLEEMIQHWTKKVFVGEMEGEGQEGNCSTVRPQEVLRNMYELK